jgi:hypothetical protein
MFGIRSRLILMVGGFLLTSAALRANDLGLGFVDCGVHSDPIEVNVKASSATPVVATVKCGERFTVLLRGEILSRIQTKTGKVGFIYTYLITRDDSAPDPLATATPPSEPQVRRVPVQTQPEPAQVSPADVEPAYTGPIPTKIVAGSKVFIEDMGGFEKYLAAAILKRKVQLVLVADKSQADYVISGTSKEKMSEWAKDVFLLNIHAETDADVMLKDRKSSAILFTFTVEKKSTLHGAQTTAEECAKHLEEQIEREK